MSVAVALPTMAGTPARTRERAAERAAALPALTGIRFFAALWVVLLHISQPTLAQWGAPAWLRHIVAQGYVGVDLFFLLSGFILALGYSTPTGALRGTSRAFWVARGARVYPVYLLALLLLLLLAVPGTLGGWTGVPSLLLSVGMLQAWLPQTALALNAPGWSLCAEAFFYALFPWLLRPLARLRPRGLLLAMAALWGLLLLPAVLYALLRSAAPAGDFTDPWLLALAFNPALRLPEFGLGMALGRLYAQQRALPADARAPAAPPAWLGAGALVCGLLLLATGPRLPFVLVQHGLLDPCFAVLLYALAWGTGPLARALAWRPLLLLGEASYGLYILQQPVWTLLAWALHVPVGLALRLPAFVVLDLGLSVALSVLSLRLLEHPARRAIRRALVPALALQQAGQGREGGVVRGAGGDERQVACALP